MTIKLTDLLRGSEGKTDGYSLALQVARVRAAYQRSYFAPALFSLMPVETDLIGSMAVDSQWRLYYNDAWLTTHTVEENATLLIHEVSHLLRDHETRKTQAGVRDHRRWNTAGDCEINDDLQVEGPSAARAIRRCPPSTDWRAGTPPRPTTSCFRNRRDRTGRRSPGRPPVAGLRIGRARRTAILGAARPDDEREGGTPGVDRLKADLVRREVARRIDETSPYTTDVVAGLATVGPRDADAARSTTWQRFVTPCAERCVTARSADTTARTGARTAGRPATASSSCRASTSRDPGRVF